MSDRIGDMRTGRTADRVPPGQLLGEDIGTGDEFGPETTLVRCGDCGFVLGHTPNELMVPHLRGNTLAQLRVARDYHYQTRHAL